MAKHEMTGELRAAFARLEHWLQELEIARASGDKGGGSAPTDSCGNTTNSSPYSNDGAHPSIKTRTRGSRGAMTSSGKWNREPPGGGFRP